VRDVARQPADGKALGVASTEIDAVGGVLTGEQEVTTRQARASVHSGCPAPEPDDGRDPVTVDPHERAAAVRRVGLEDDGAVSGGNHAGADEARRGSNRDIVHYERSRWCSLAADASRHGPIMARQRRRRAPRCSGQAAGCFQSGQSGRLQRVATAEGRAERGQAGGVPDEDEDGPLAVDLVI
jgi:hypothetical protein